MICEFCDKAFPTDKALQRHHQNNTMCQKIRAVVLELRAEREKGGDSDEVEQLRQSITKLEGEKKELEGMRGNDCETCIVLRDKVKELEDAIVEKDNMLRPEVIEAFKQRPLVVLKHIQIDSTLPEEVVEEVSRMLSEDRHSNFSLCDEPPTEDSRVIIGPF